MTAHLRAQWRRTAMPRGPLPSGIEYRHTPPRDPYAGPNDKPSGHHSISAFLNGKQIGWLTWFDPGENDVTRNNPGYAEEYTKIDKVEVALDYRRRGLASEMLRRAREITPGIKHSDRLTGDGREWRDSVSPDEAGTPAYPSMMRSRLGAQAGVYYHVTSYRNWADIRANGLRPGHDGHVWLFTEADAAMLFKDGWDSSGWRKGVPPTEWNVPPCIVVIRTDRAVPTEAGIPGAYWVEGPITKAEIYDVIRPEDLHHYAGRTASKVVPWAEVERVNKNFGTAGSMLYDYVRSRTGKSPQELTWTLETHPTLDRMVETMASPTRLAEAERGYREHPEQMPPVVILEDESGDREHIDGWHRLTAAERVGIAEVPAYVARWRFPR